MESKKALSQATTRATAGLTAPSLALSAPRWMFAQTVCPVLEAVAGQAG